MSEDFSFGGESYGDFIKFVPQSSMLDYSRDVPYFLDPTSAGNPGFSGTNFLSPYGDPSITPQFSTAAPYEFDPNTGTHGGPNRPGTTTERISSVAKQVANALSKLQGGPGAAAQRAAQGNGQIIPAGAPRAFNFNTPSVQGSFKSPITYATEGAQEFSRFLSFLQMISPLLGDSTMRQRRSA